MDHIYHFFSLICTINLIAACKRDKFQFGPFDSLNKQVLSIFDSPKNLMIKEYKDETNKKIAKGYAFCFFLVTVKGIH
jgi:hypothetical protein